MNPTQNHASAKHRLWLAPAAWRELGAALQQRGRAPLELDPRMVATELQGPATMLLCAADLEPPQRDWLLELAQRAVPGRPVIWGGARSRDALLDAINAWQAAQLLPANSPIDLLLDALDKAAKAASMEVALHEGTQNLSRECRRLESALSELNRTQGRLLRAERIANVARVTHTLATRLQGERPPLAEFRSAFMRLTNEPELRELADCVTIGLDSVERLLADMLALSEERKQTHPLLPAPLDPLVSQAARLFKLDRRSKQRRFEHSCHSDAVVRMDRHALLHALLNMLRNALEATEEGQLIALRTYREGDQAVIEVEDRGCGMPPEVLAKIFKPYFTTKERGLGLGVRISQAAFERHGGELDCSSAPGQGTRFRALLSIEKTDAKRTES